MKLQDLVAVSGLPGLYRVIGNRSNGLIIEALDSGKRRFASSRKHRFSPLETISIFTPTDSIKLEEVFEKIHNNVDEVPLPQEGDSDDEYRDYFKTVLPEHDEQRVYPRDIKKVVKWYSFLRDQDLLSDEEE